MITEKFIARHPILNKERKTVAYELLFRNSDQNRFPTGFNDDQATKNIIYNSFLEIGIDEISSGKQLLINIDENTLHDDIILTLPTQKINLEILETIPPTTKNVERIKKLKEHGFNIVLDDFVLNNKTKMFVPLCSLIKLDIREMKWEQIEKEVALYKKFGKKVLAEKVETEDEFLKCKSLNFDYYQGFFFSKPQMLKKKSIQSNNYIVFSAYSALVNEKSYTEIANFISMDLGLAERFLKYSYDIITRKGKRTDKVSSVYQALCFIGYEDTLKFLNLSILNIANENNTPEEIIKMSFVRASFLQSIFSNNGNEYKNRAHLTGFFSLLHVLLDMPLLSILSKLNLHEDIEEALTYKEGDLGLALEIIEGLEKEDYSLVEDNAKSLNLSLKKVNHLYQQAIKWESKLKIFK